MDDASTDRSPGSRRIRAGCLLIVLGLLVLGGTALARAAGASRAALAVPAVIALVLLVPAFGYLVLVGVRMRRRAARGLDGLAFAAPVPLDVAMLRRIESSRLPALARWERFPTGIRASRQIANGGSPISLAVNLPSLRSTRDAPLEPASCYLWFPMPVALPRLILRPDGPDGALLGADVDVENEAFNRRFRVDSALPLLDRGADYAEFSRYAHAVLHPRAVEVLTRLPRGVHAALDGPVCFAIDRVDSDRERIGRIAEVLTELVSTVPEHVLRRWGGQPGYRPRD